MAFNSNRYNKPAIEQMQTQIAAQPPQQGYQSPMPGGLNYQAPQQAPAYQSPMRGGLNYQAPPQLQGGQRPQPMQPGRPMPSRGQGGKGGGRRKSNAPSQLLGMSGMGLRSALGGSQPFPQPDSYQSPMPGGLNYQGQQARELTAFPGYATTGQGMDESTGIPWGSQQRQYQALQADQQMFDTNTMGMQDQYGQYGQMVDNKMGLQDPSQIGTMGLAGGMGQPPPPPGQAPPTAGKGGASTGGGYQQAPPPPQTPPNPTMGKGGSSPPQGMKQGAPKYGSSQGYKRPGSYGGGKGG
jgi:hypothetical protein